MGGWINGIRVSNFDPATAIVNKADPGVNVQQVLAKTFNITQTEANKIIERSGDTVFTIKRSGEKKPKKSLKEIITHPVQAYKELQQSAKEIPITKNIAPVELATGGTSTLSKLFSFVKKYKKTSAVAIPLIPLVGAYAIGHPKQTAKAPLDVGNYYGNLVKTAYNPSVANAKEVFTENPLLAGLTVAGLTYIGAKTIFPALQSYATYQNTQAIQDQTKNMSKNIPAINPSVSNVDYKGELDLLEAQTKSQLQIQKAEFEQQAELFKLQQSAIPKVMTTPGYPAYIVATKPKKKKKKAKKKTKKKKKSKKKTKKKKKSKKKKTIKRRKN